MNINHYVFKNVMLSFLLIPCFMMLISADGKKEKKTLEVMATAYNSVPEQTDDNPLEAAWGDTLDPDIKSIAVSHDLLNMGLKPYSKVKIEGMQGEYVVLDKMNRRWVKKIDIYMGTDVDEALEWGVKKVIISWEAGH